MGNRVKVRSARAPGFDGLNVLAVCLCLIYGVMAGAWCRRYNAGHLLWFCDVALLLTAVGLLLRSRALVTAQLVAVCIFHLVWNVDFWLCLLFGYLPFDATGYMFFHDLSLGEKGLSFFSHVFLVPAALYGVFALGAPKRAWLLQWAQTLVVFTLTYLLTRPEENINRVFGFEVFHLSLAGLPPPAYYALMITLPPLLIYLPTNRLLTMLFRQPALKALPARISGAFMAALIIAALAASVAVAWVADRQCVLDANLFEVSSAGVARLESPRPGGARTPVDQILYELGGGVRQVPLLVWPHAALPKQWSGLDRKLHAHTKSVLLELAADDIPAAPQEVLLRGPRTVRGSVVWAYVASDDFYVQPHPDLHGERAAYEVRCKLGGRGLSEYVDPADGRLFAPNAYSEILGSGTGAIYALGIVEVLRGEVVAQSAYYLVKRKGLRSPEDVWFVESAGGLTPLLSKPTDPLNARVAFQSPLTPANSKPEVFTCDFFGYDLRNLSASPDRFDGFTRPEGAAVEAVGWLDATTLRYYAEGAGGVVRSGVQGRD
jgi:hypothetical protein